MTVDEFDPAVIVGGRRCALDGWYWRLRRGTPAGHQVAHTGRTEREDRNRGVDRPRSHGLSCGAKARKTLPEMAHRERFGWSYGDHPDWSRRQGCQH